VLSNDASKYARQYAAHSLGRLRDTRAIEPLIEAMLNDEYCGVRSVAVKRLQPFGYRQELVLALKDDSSHVRREVATVLGRTRDTRAVEPLKEALKDPDIGVQCEAAIALGEFRDIAAIDSLISVTDCNDENLRRAAAKALGNIGDPRAIQALIKASDDPNRDVRNEGKMALEKIKMRAS
jgi:HEAT repeat protein